jgi:hypothetical protein
MVMMFKIRYGWKYANEHKDEIVSTVINVGYKTKTNIGQSDFISITKEHTNALSGTILWANLVWSSGDLFNRIKYKFKHFNFPYSLEYRGWRKYAAKGEFLLAIKEYRAVKGCGLREAKDFIENHRIYKKAKAKARL